MKELITNLFSRKWDTLFDDGVFYSCYALTYRDRKLRMAFRDLHGTTISRNRTITIGAFSELQKPPFTGNVLVSNLKATRQGNRITLKWNVLNPGGYAEIKLSTTNTFQKGRPDSYTPIGKTKVSDGTYSFDPPASSTGFYKVFLVAPQNTTNIWIKTK